jgi:small subunit ribosomal protein S2
MNIAIKDLLDAGVHFGHQVKRWNPKCKPFLFDHRHGMSIINLERSYELLAEAAQFVEDVVAGGGKILFVATKKQAQDIVREAAVSVQMPFCVNRWMGGTLTNFQTITSSLKKYKQFLKMEDDGSLGKLPGKEAAAIKHQMSRMHRNFEGMLEVDELPTAVFIVDVRNEEIAVREAHRLNIPCVGLVDTNSDPSQVSHPVPGNDDASKSIRIVTEVIVEAVQTGKARQATQQIQSGITPLIRAEFGEDQEDLEVTLPEGYEEIVAREVSPATEPAPISGEVASAEEPSKEESPTEEAETDVAEDSPVTDEEAGVAEESEEESASDEAAPAEESSKEPESETGKN